MLVVLSLQLKVVVVECSGQPHLVFIPTKTIDVGDELLFNYNDRQSSLPFLKNCPVCGDEARVDRKRPAVDNEAAPEAKRQPAMSEPDVHIVAAEPATSAPSDHGKEPDQTVKRPPDYGEAASGANLQPATSQSVDSDAAQPTTSAPSDHGKAADQTDKRPPDYDEMKQLVSATKLDKTQRRKLMVGVNQQFSMSTRLTRSQLEAWKPNISDNNVRYILLQRNVLATNAMCTKMMKQNKKKK